MMDIPNRGDIIKAIEKVPHSELKSRFLSKKQWAGMSDLELQLVNYKEAGNYFLFGMILLIVGSVLVLGFGNQLRTGYMNVVYVVYDVSRITSHNWATHSFGELMKSIGKYQAGQLVHLIGCTASLEMKRRKS